MPEPAPVEPAPTAPDHAFALNPEPAPIIYAPPPPADISPATHWPPPVEPSIVPPPEPPELPEPRIFGKPVDATAHAELLAAAGEEQKWQTPDLPEPEPPQAEFDTFQSLPLFLTSEHPDDPVIEALPLTPDAEPGQDRFAELVYAARNKSIEYEPEPLPSRKGVGTTNTSVFIALVVALILACIVVEHRNIERLLPASAILFTMLGLK